MLESGRAMEAGSLGSLRQAGGYVSSLNWSPSSDPSRNILDLTSARSDDVRQDSPGVTVDTALVTAEVEEVTSPERQKGDFSVYSYYSRAAGHKVMAAFLATMLMNTFCTEFSS